MTSRSRRAQLRLEVLDERAEDFPEYLEDVPKMLQRWNLHLEVVECVWVVAYDAHMTVKTVIEVGRGTHTRSEVHIPTVMAAVITAGCERFMLVHNHPTKRLKPSKGDIDLTRKIMAAANTCGLFFEDHIILSPNGKWTSLTQRGIIQPANYLDHVNESDTDNFLENHDAIDYA